MKRDHPLEWGLESNDILKYIWIEAESSLFTSKASNNF